MQNMNGCMHFSVLPPSMRIAYTLTLVVLGIGYAFAMIHIFASHAGRDGNPMLSVQDLVIAYSGSKADTRLEVAIKGPMAAMLPQHWEPVSLRSISLWIGNCPGLTTEHRCYRKN